MAKIYLITCIAQFNLPIYYVYSIIIYKNPFIDTVLKGLNIYFHFFLTECSVDRQGPRFCFRGKNAIFTAYPDVNYDGME